jgi:hypothetical protein
MQRKYLGPILFGGTLLFTQDLAQQIMLKLQDYPYKEVAPLIAKINEEAMHQPAPQSHVEQPAIPPTPAAPTPASPFPPPAPTPSAAPIVPVPTPPTPPSATPTLPPADIPPEPK